MELFKIEKADFSSISTDNLINLYLRHQSKFSKEMQYVSGTNYLYWDKIRHLTPPEGVSALEFWYIVRFVRDILSKKTIIKSEKGNYFNWIRLDYTDQYLHKIDITVGGEIFSHYHNIITPYGKQRLLTKSIIEEAIASSQLEGAVTTTPMAKKLILENRPPKDKSERMIVNNYKTMKAITEGYKDQALSNEMLFELHKLITKDTLDTDKQGRYRVDSDDITINDQFQYIYHIPPKEDFLKDQMAKLIKYANEDQEEFTHPIIKAIFLHFWIGYLHPFYDGNGRLARTLFYWYLIRKGYWGIQYLPISLVIRNAPTKYGMSFVYTEQDNLDLTYFYDFHIKKIIEALNNFEDYIRNKTIENDNIQNTLDAKYKLNIRQQELLRYLIAKGKDSYITPSSFIALYKVSRETTNKDLKSLENLKLVEKKRYGKNMRYYSSSLLRSELNK